MTIRDLLATSGLTHVDAELLLGHVLGKSRAWLMAHAHDEPDAKEAAAFEAFVKRRNAGEPVAYITGEKEFYGRTFNVRTGVLIPRPCTEELVSCALDLLDGKGIEETREIDNGIVRAARWFGTCAGLSTVVDVGTGSGCIAITLACERPDVRCIAIDSSAEALEIAKENAEKHGVADRVEFREGDCLEPIEDLDEPFLVVTNPPYVTDVALLASDVLMHEPRAALIGGGHDGGDVLREIVAQAAKRKNCRGIVAECLAAQAPIILGSRAPRPT